MPMPAESLTPQSTAEEVRAAISATIAKCVEEGGEQKQCTAIAFSMARRQTSGLIRQGLEQGQ